MSIQPELIEKPGTARGNVTAIANLDRRIRKLEARGGLNQGAITHDVIQSGTITAAEIAVGTITATNILAGTITTNEIAAHTITAGNILAGTITATEIAAGTITAGKIAANTITANEIAAHTITAGKIAANTITANEIAAHTITANEIAAGSITANSLSITAPGSNFVTNSSFANGIPGWGISNSSSSALVATPLFPGTTGKTLSVTSNGTSPIQVYQSSIPIQASSPYFGSVWVQAATTGRSAYCWITWFTAAGANISSAGGVQAISTTTGWTRYDVSATSPSNAAFVEIGCNIYNPVNGEVHYIGAFQLTQSDVPAAYDASGPKDINATLITPNSITTNQIAANTITAGNIVAGTITSNEIAAHTITAGDIVAGTITTTEIAATTIVAGNIAANTITAAQIAAGTITATQIAANTITAGKIAAGTITANEIAAHTILAGNIVAGTITTNEIAAGTILGGDIAGSTITGANIAAATITAGLINVANLSAVSANMGTVTGGVFQTATSGARVMMGTGLTTPSGITSGIAGIDAGGAETFHIDSATGNVVLTGTLTAKSGSNLPTSTITGYMPGSANRYSSSAFIDGAGNFTTGPYQIGGGTGGATTADGGTTVPPVYGVHTCKVTSIGSGGIYCYDPANVTTEGGKRRVVQGVSYTFSHYVWPVTNGRQSQINVRWFDSSGTQIGGDVGGATVNNTANQWNRIVQTQTAPTGAAYGYGIHYVAGAVAGDVWYLDCLQMEEGDRASAWSPRPDEILINSINANMIQAHVIAAGQITAGSITTTEIASATILAGNIHSGTITTSEIAANTILAANISGGTITGTQIAATTIAAGNIVANCLATGQIQAGGIDADRIVTHSLTTLQIQSGGIDADRIVANSLTTAQIQAGGVNADRLVANSVTASRLSIKPGDGNLVKNSSFANGTTGWSSTGTLATAASPVFVGSSGTVVAQLTSIGAGNLTLNSGTGVNSTPVNASTTYTLSVWARTASVARPFNARIFWYDSAGTFISQFDGPQSTMNTTSWTRADYTLTSPSNAAFASVRALIIAGASGEVYYIGALQLQEGDVPSSYTPSGPQDINAGTFITPTSITTGQIAANAITATQIAANTITATQLNIVPGGRNLVTNSSFANGLTGWTAANTSAFATSTTIAFPGSTGAQVAQLTSNATSPMTMTSPTGTSGIPVRPSTAYVTSAWVEASVNARVTGLNVIWYTAAGAVISTTNGPTATPSTSAWTQLSASATSPSNAAFAALQVSAASPASGDILYIGALMLQVGTVGTAYSADGPLDINAGTQITPNSITTGQIAASAITAAQIAAGTITSTQIASGTITADDLSAGAITSTNLQIVVGPGNLVPNNNFTPANPTLGWTAANATLSSVTGTAWPRYYGNGTGNVLSLTGNGTSPSTLSSATGTSGIAVVGNTQYIAAAWVATAVTARTATVNILWYTAAGALISTTSGFGVTDSASYYKKLTATAVSPATAAFAAVQVSFTSVANAEIHYVGGVMLQKGNVIDGFNDNGSVVFPASSTLGIYTDAERIIWERGTDNVQTAIQSSFSQANQSYWFVQLPIADPNATSISIALQGNGAAASNTNYFAVSANPTLAVGGYQFQVRDTSSTMNTISFAPMYTGPDSQIVLYASDTATATSFNTNGATNFVSNTQAGYWDWQINSVDIAQLTTGGFNVSPTTAGVGVDITQGQASAGARVTYTKASGANATFASNVTGGSYTGPGILSTVTLTAATTYQLFKGQAGTSPSDKFFVDGTGVIHSTATSITAISDARLKRDIQPMKGSLDIVLNLKPSQWYWEDHPLTEGFVDRPHYGLVADDVEKVLPHLVDNDEWEFGENKEAFKSLRYTDTIPYLIGAIQELEKRLATLEA